MCKLLMFMSNNFTIPLNSRLKKKEIITKVNIFVDVILNW